MKREWWQLIAAGTVACVLSACGPQSTEFDGSAGSSDGGDDTPSEREPNCTESDSAFFSRAIWPTLSATCATCHGTTNASNLTFSTDESSAYDSVRSYIEQFGDAFVNKPTNQNGSGHAGGQQITPESDLALDFSEMVSRVEQPVTDCQDTGEQAQEAGFADVTNISVARTVRKASILLQGRLPTDNEIAQAEASDDGLETVLSRYLDGDEFDEWLMNSANDHLLTRKYFTGQTEAQEALAADTYNYTGLYNRTSVAFDAAEAADVACEAAGGSPASDAEQAECVNAYTLRRQANITYSETQRALAEEPLELIRYVVNNNRPYSEVLTADYMMMNPFTYDALDGSSWTTAYDEMDPTDWRPGNVRQYRVAWNTTLQAKTGQEFVPSAGILSSPVFQLRYPSTDTNRNRARARWTYYYFLGIDIERLAVRAMDAEELKNVTNPGAEGTSCFGCHQVMDPVAGAFQSWGNAGQYLVRNGEDSLPQLYVDDNEDYVEGDQWYRGQLIPGFNGTDMPAYTEFGKASSHEDGLQWLAEQMVADDRFATGTAKFWFKGLFGRDPLLAPTEPADAQYSTQLQAYLDEQELIGEWAETFRNNDLNLKTLLVEMMMSPLFRGESIDSTDMYRLAALDSMGIGRLLTPEQLERKLLATTGFEWRYYWQTEGKLLESYYMFYGGIDSDGITERADVLNSMMFSVVDRMANELSCELVAQEFWPDMPRFLFEGVEITTDPNTAEGEAAIRSTIMNLMWHLWGISDTAEQDALWALYKALYDQRIADEDISNYLSVNDDDDSRDEHCVFADYDETDGIDIEMNWGDITDWRDVEHIRSHLGSYYNPEQTLRPWVGVLAAMLTDIQFITE